VAAFCARENEDNPSSAETEPCARAAFKADKRPEVLAMATRTPQLIARDLFQSFRIGARRIEVLRGISIEIARNEAVFLSGASGAGKTTLLYTLAGLERPQGGTVEFEGLRLYNGSSATEARLRNEKMGFVFQGYFLLPELTALENVLLPAMIGRRATLKRAWPPSVWVIVCITCPQNFRAANNSASPSRAR